MKSSKKISRIDFQVYFAIGVILGLLFLSALYFAIFVDHAMFGLLMPFGILGVLGILSYVGGKVYDRINRD